MIRNEKTGVVTAFSVVGGGVGGGPGAMLKPFQKTFINQIGDNNLNYSGAFVSVDITGAANGPGLTLGYAYTPQKKFDGWKVWEYLAQDDGLSYSYIIGPAIGEGVNVSGSYVYYTPLFDYVDGKIISHHGQLTQEQIDYLLPIVEQGMSILDEQ